MTETGYGRRDRIGLSLYYLFTFASVGFGTPFLPLYWRSLGLSYLEIGIVVAVGSAAGTLVLIPAGVLSDRLHKRHPFVIGGSLLVGACFTVYPHLTEYWQLLFAQALIGMGGTVSISAASALGADLFHHSVAGRSFAGVRSWGTVGFLLTMAFAYLNPGISEAGRFLPLTAALGATAGVVILMVSRPNGDEAVRVIRLRDAGQILRNRNTAAFVLVYLLGFMALMPATANLSLYIQSFQPKPAPSMIPIAYAVSGACELPFLMGMGWAADRFGRVLPMRVCFLVLPVRLVLYSLIPDPALVLLLQATHGLTFSVLAVVPFAFMADASPPQYRATGQAILNAAGGLANTVGLLAAGRAADVLGIRNLYSLLAGFALIGAIILFLFVKEPARPPSAIDTNTAV